MLENEKSSPGRTWLLVVLLLALGGLGVSVDLSVLHWRVHNQPGHVSFCAISEGVNCDTVAMSSYAVVAGVPVSTWAALFYLLAAMLALWGMLRSSSPWPWSLLTTLFAVAVGASTWLFAVSELVIHSLCIMCMASYLINLAAAVICILGLRRAGLSPSGGAALVLAVALAGAGVFLAFFPERALGSAFFLMTAGALLVGFAVVLVVGGGRGMGGLLRRLGPDVAGIFRWLPVGVALTLLAAGTVAAALIITPRLYPEQRETIAGGLAGIETGRTAEGHNWIGAAAPEVTITEYSDYECPFCRRAHELVRRLVRERKDWLRLVHVHVPLDHSCNPMVRKPFHRHACACARAAICADRQDRFWAMNDALFLRRCGLDAGGLAVLAGRLGLDTEDFRACMNEKPTEETLQENIQECRQVAIECRKMGRGFGTPTFTVDGRVVVGLKKKSFWVRLVDEIRRRRRGSSERAEPAKQQQPGEQQPDDP